MNNHERIASGSKSHLVNKNKSNQSDTNSKHTKNKHLEDVNEIFDNSSVEISTDEKQSERKNHSRHKIADLNINITKQESINNLPFSRVTAKLLIHLAPSFLKNVEVSIMEYLEEIMFRYVPQLKGFPISLETIGIPDGAGYLFEDTPFTSIWVDCEMISFIPEKVGVVQLQSPTHIGMLLYRYYNASIPIQYIPTDKFRWRPNKEWTKPTLDIESVSLGNWIDLTNDHVIEKDDEVGFEVVELEYNEFEEVCTVIGTLGPKPSPEDLIGSSYPFDFREEILQYEARHDIKLPRNTTGEA
ncbi:6061_t:CDS:2 [Ambispora gerdemannii]|uniref:6061_t:CDS:1 n=1 Tax=Ambispora gerdemannii TaxID=144530 RepID=A0A9N9BXQ2_9GLOM|nr:6061_t:CDS:2 [Ambispora gerdemannii]